MTRLYTFRCPICTKRFEYDSDLEPMCTGPSETRDEHLPHVMVLASVRVRRDARVVDPVRALAKSQGPLIIPAR